MRPTPIHTVIATVFVAGLLVGAVPASAQVTRCTDAAGKVSYTDKACPSSTRQATQLEGIETNGTSITVAGTKATQPSGVATPTPTQAPVPVRPDSGLVVIDPRAPVPLQDRTDREVARDGGDPYAYPGYPGAYRRNWRQPQNPGPTLRNCDAGGCSDTMGNHYDRAGKVDRYVRPDGRTCRPVGTTVVC